MLERFKNAWDAFRGRSPTSIDYYGGSDPRAVRPIIRGDLTKSIVNLIYVQISSDISLMNFRHAKLDDEGKFSEEIKSTLNYVLSSSANLDQTGRALIKDCVITMLSEGAAAMVPIKTDVNPYLTESFQVEEVRVGTIVGWYPRHVRVSVYDERFGQRRDLVIEKRLCSIVVNPFYEIMNQPNSTMKRLIRTLNQLDQFNDENSVGKLDLIFQLPYSVSKKIKKDQAEERRQDIVRQLTHTKLGIAYVDSTEKITQLNRPVENGLWAQAKDLTVDLFNQLGLCEAIFNGTADEQTILNYHNRTLEPILNALTEEMTRKWLSITAQTQKQAVVAYSNPFRFVPVSVLAEVSDKLTRNEILTSNEVRSILGYRPKDDPKADQLINSNLNQPEQKEQSPEDGKTEEQKDDGIGNAAFRAGSRKIPPDLLQRLGKS